MNMSYSLILSILIPMIGAAVVYLAGDRMGKKNIGSFSIAVSSATLLLVLFIMSFGDKVQAFKLSLPWISTFGVNMSFYYDGISSIVLLVTALITTICIWYSTAYFGDDIDHKGYYALVLFFMSSVMGVALAGDLILFYLFWEAMLLPSFALVAFMGEDKVRSGAIALKYFIITHVGAVAILIAILIISSLTGVTDIMAVRGALIGLDPSMISVLAALFIFGLSVKMAMFPFHSWLPDAYENAPTPATALISSVMMNAPIYAFLRFFNTMFPLDAMVPFVLIIMLIALISQVYGAVMSMVESNIKRMIAYSSISQMGYVMLAIGSMTLLGKEGAAFHMINHAVVKCLLFMTVGSVFLSVSKYGTKDLGGLAAKLPYTALFGSVAALAIAGMPLFGVFQSEWLIFAGALSSQYKLIAILAVCGSVFTAAYALLFIARIFFGEQKGQKVKSEPIGLLMPMGLLALITLLIGLWPKYLFDLVRAAVRMLGA